MNSRVCSMSKCYFITQVPMDGNVELNTNGTDGLLLWSIGLQDTAITRGMWFLFGESTCSRVTVDVYEYESFLLVYISQ